MKSKGKGIVRHRISARVVSLKAKLVAYQRQGFWGRLLGRVPVVVLFVEPAEK